MFLGYQIDSFYVPSLFHLCLLLICSLHNILYFAGMTAPQAAGVIHSDFEKGFIRAETVRNYGRFYLNSHGFASHMEIMCRIMEKLTQSLET